MAEDESSAVRSLSARLTKVENKIVDPERIARLEKAAEGHERNASDLARAQTDTARIIAEATKELDERVKMLETDRQERRIAEAAANVEDKQLRSDVHEIKVFIKSMQDGNIIGKVQDMSGGFNRLFWLVIGAVESNETSVSTKPPGL